MTREEAINNIKELQDTYITCRGEEDTVAVSLDGFDIEALDMAIKALEQEPIIDKAIAEIDRIGCVCHASDNYDELIRKNTVLKILNKYKAESEVDNGNDK